MGLRLGVLAALAALAAAVANPEEYVNTLGGTDSRYDFSRGNTLPLVTTPWGFTAWAPQTDNDGCYSSWTFHPTDRRFFGVVATHTPSPWISNWGAMRIMASIADPGHSDTGQASAYDPTASAFSPYFFNASLLSYGTASAYTTVEVTSTNHAAIIRVSYPAFDSNAATAGAFNQTRRIMLVLNTAGVDVLNVAASPPGVTGYTRQNSGGAPFNFAAYYNLTIAGGVDGSIAVTPFASGTGSDGGGPYAFFDFDPTDSDTNVLTIRVATSLISVDQASLNLAAEVSGLSFDEAMAASKATWRQTLSQADVIDVGASFYTPTEQQAMLTTFYSNLYRASIFPRFLDEVSANGTTQHYSPYDPLGRTYPGSVVTDSGFWDAYRTVYPQLSLLHPATLGKMIQGWTTAFNEGGWLPKWASPGYRGSMVGTMGDVSLADAIVKGIPGFDRANAYAAIRKDAFVLPPAGNSGEGRTCLAAYLADGYVAAGAQGAVGTCTEAVSRTQNYWLSDWAIAQAAKVLNQTQDALILEARAQNWTRLFEPNTGFFRTRATGQGAFVEPFDQFAWGDPYTEAGPWQYRFYVPFNTSGLAALYASSGRDLCDTIDEMNTMQSTFHIGSYGDEIHEMTEMALNCWGQYEHDNQPVHDIQMQYIAADTSLQGSCANRGQYWIRQVLTRLYKPSADMFSGDEDNGEMASWYLLNALGLYTIAPGSPDYLLTSPLFAHVSIPLDATVQAAVLAADPRPAAQRLPRAGGAARLKGAKHGKASAATAGASPTLEIQALNNCATCYYVSSVSFNGESITGTTISYFDLMAGGALQFTMTDKSPSGVVGGARHASAGAIAAAPAAGAAPAAVGRAGRAKVAKLRARK